MKGGRMVRVARLGSFAVVAALVAGALVGGCGTKASVAPTASEAGSETPGSSASTEPVRIARGAHPLARPDLDVGPVDPARRIQNLSLVFKLSPEQLRDRDALLADLVDPGSPR